MWLKDFRLEIIILSSICKSIRSSEEENIVSLKSFKYLTSRTVQHEAEEGLFWHIILPIISPEFGKTRDGLDGLTLLVSSTGCAGVSGSRPKGCVMCVYGTDLRKNRANPSSHLTGNSAATGLCTQVTKIRRLISCFFLLLGQGLGLLVFTCLALENMSRWLTNDGRRWRNIDGCNVYRTPILFVEKISAIGCGRTRR